jgi:hypothetical protein
MLLAHFLWRGTPEGATADEQTFLRAQGDALAEAGGHLRAIFKALTPNEKRVMVAIANLDGSPREAANVAAVGIRRGSVSSTLEALRARGDIIETRDVHPSPVITDPLFELWLRERGASGLPRAVEDQ